MVAAIALPSELSKAQAKAIEEFSFIPEVRLPFRSQPTNIDKIAFWTLQGLDIYTTYRGVKYTCIKEGNPLLNDVPTILDMATLKYFNVVRYQPKTLKEYQFHNSFATIVVYNNYQIWNKAKSRCGKR